jgi:hypothetical protein
VKAAREHVTVALSGDGGDELWASHARHRVERWGSMARQLGTGAGFAGRLAGDCRSGSGCAIAAAPALSPAEACARKRVNIQVGRARGALASISPQRCARRSFAGFRLAYASCASPDRSTARSTST